MRAEQFYCDGVLATTPGSSAPWQAFVQAMAISHDATRDAAGAAVGDPTEVALLVAAERAGCDGGQELARSPRVAELPFDSERKCMTTVHRLADGTHRHQGRSRVIIGLCAREQRAAAPAPFVRQRLGERADDGN
jgi:Ca2+-transporting ATPase